MHLVAWSRASPSAREGASRASAYTFCDARRGDGVENAKGGAKGGAADG